MFCPYQLAEFAKSDPTSRCDKCQEFLQVQAISSPKELLCEGCRQLINRPKQRLGTCTDHLYCAPCRSQALVDPSKLKCSRCKPSSTGTPCYQCRNQSGSIILLCEHSYCPLCYAQFVESIVRRFQAGLNNFELINNQSHSFGCPERCPASDCFFSAQDLVLQTGCQLRKVTQGFLNRYHCFFDGIPCKFGSCFSCNDIVAVYSAKQWRCERCSACFYCKSKSHDESGCTSQARG